MVNKMATEVVVITVPSRKTTVPEQLRLGFADVRVYVDECMRGGARVTQNGIRLATGNEHVLLSEDDILVCDDLYGAVKAAEFPSQVGVICYCDMREMPTDTPRGGSDGLGWWGNQCLLIHKEVVLYLQIEDWFVSEVCNHPGVLSHAVAFRLAPYAYKVVKEKNWLPWSSFVGGGNLLLRYARDAYWYAAWLEKRVWQLK
jgi:hypothetical protein